MEILKFFPSTKKNLEETEKMEKEQRDRNERIHKNIKEEIKKKEIEEARIKIIQPLDIDKMKEFKNRTIQFINQCKKKEYIYDYFQHMSSNVFFNKNNRRPFLTELEDIIIETIPKHEEQELHILMANLEYDRTLNKEILAKTYSHNIIDTLYDFCVSVDTELANNVVV